MRSVWKKNKEPPAAVVRLSIGRTVPLHLTGLFALEIGPPVWTPASLLRGLGSPGQWKVSFTSAGWGGIVGWAGQASSTDPQVEGVHQRRSLALIPAADWSSRRRSWAAWRANPSGPDPAGSRSPERTSSWGAPSAPTGTLGLRWRGAWSGRCWGRCGRWMAGGSLRWRWRGGRCRSSGWWLPVWHARTLWLPPWSCLRGWITHFKRGVVQSLIINKEANRSGNEMDVGYGFTLRPVQLLLHSSMSSNKRKARQWILTVIDCHLW